MEEEKKPSGFFDHPTGHQTERRKRGPQTLRVIFSGKLVLSDNFPGLFLKIFHLLSTYYVHYAAMIGTFSAPFI
jgi:hypothetical protein